MRYSEAGLAMTKEFEGLRLEAYRDSAGIWTIGYGHTGRDVVAGRKLTETEAERLLRADLEASVVSVNGAAKVELKQGQFDALVDFCFNVGRGSLMKSSLLRMVNAGEFVGAAEEFGKWVNAGGVWVSGLERRRAAEAEMFRG